MKQNHEVEHNELIAFITEDDKGEFDFQVSPSVQKKAYEIQQSLAYKKDLIKGLDDVHQSADEIKQNNYSALPVTSRGAQVIEPPYDPQSMADLLESDETHFRAVTAKVLDSVGRSYMIDSFAKVVDEFSEDQDESDYLLKSEFKKESKQIKDFIRLCNPLKGFEEVIRSAAMDRESIGWGAIEVTRNLDKSIRHIQHIPASRLKVLRDWRGFVEVRNTPGDGQYTFYQNFGEKVGVRSKLPSIVGGDNFEPYDPIQHGKMDSSEVGWNLISKKDGTPTDDLAESANEVLWLVKSHPNTIYYGYSDVVPALSALIANSKIKDYLLQFFEHNTVPRYVVTVKGSNIDDEFRRTITNYFQKEVKGKAHTTLVLALPNSGGKSVDVEFKKIDTDSKEADFLDTYRANSQQIQTSHGTSPAILGIAEQSSLGSGKGLSQAELYKDRIVTPSQKYWQDQLYRLLSKGLGIIHSYIKFDPLDIRDLRMQMEVHTGLLDRGVLDINEVRNEMSYDTVPGGNYNFLRTSNGTILKIADLKNLPTSVVDFSAQAPNENLANAESSDLDKSKET